MAASHQSLWSRCIEPREQIDGARQVFSNASLKAMVLPLFLEQLLVASVGIADTLMVSYAGEAAVSGVTLVNMFVTIFIFLFTAMASGGAAVVSQYIGSRDTKNGCLAASQLFAVLAAVSVASMVLVLTLHRFIVGALFGRASPDVMRASITYLRISAYSFPAMALHNAGAAVYRSMGDTRTVMRVSLAMNVLNVIGNAIGVFVLHAGVTGVAWPSLIARLFAAVVMTMLCFSRRNQIFVTWKAMLHWNRAMVRRLLRVAVPNGIDNGMLQLTKVALSSITALFGTSQIAANGVAQSLWSVSALVGVALGPAFTTVVGQCAGAGDMGAASYYMKKLLRITVLASALWNGLILAATPVILRLYNLSPGVKELVFTLVLIHNVFCAFAFSLSSPFSYGLRAAGDVRFTMAVSIASTVFFRVLMSVILGIWCGLGVVGIAWSMVLDWCVKAVLFALRFRSGKWTTFNMLA